MGLFLGSLIHFFGLCVHVSSHTNVDYCACIMSWNLVDWVFPIFSSFPYYFNYSSSFDFPHKFMNNLIYTYKKLTDFLIRIMLKLGISFGRIDIFTLLSFPIHGHGTSLYVLDIIWFFFIRIVEFSAYKFCTYFVRFT